MLPGSGAVVNTPSEVVREATARTACIAPYLSASHMQRLEIYDGGGGGEYFCLASDAADCVICSATRDVATAPPAQAIRYNDDTSA